MATCRDLASPTSWSAHSRTCATLPGTPVVRRSPRVDGPMDTAWMESMTTSSGADSTTALITAPMSVADRINRPGGIGPSRSARSRTWWADSSADTRSTRCPMAARAASTWRRRVDLPIPGSPPRRVTEPGTRPPERTRSNSSTPVGNGDGLGDVDRRQRDRHRRQVQGVDRADQRAEVGLFDQGVPLTARGAAAGPSGGRRSTVDAAVALGRLCHAPDGRDRVCQPG